MTGQLKPSILIRSRGGFLGLVSHFSNDGLYLGSKTAGRIRPTMALAMIDATRLARILERSN